MSMKWPGGLIRKTPVTPAGPLQNGAAPGMWTLGEAAYWTKQGLWPTAGNFLAVEDVFSTWLYTANNTTQTITNGIDLAGKGGLIWFKTRNTGGAGKTHTLVDSARGNNGIFSSLTSAQSALSGGSGTITLNSNGFTINGGVFSAQGNINNGTTDTLVSWTFREAPNFFDVVTYTGNGVSGRQIAHNLGVTPGMVIVKRTDSTADWAVWQRTLSDPSKYLVLNTTAATATDAFGPWGPTGDGYTTNASSFTDTFFRVANDTRSNASGATYVAYLFAHDTSSTGLIQCGSFTPNGNSPFDVNLGWEPQWVMIKSTFDTSRYQGDWNIYDNMRGMPLSGGSRMLWANSSDAEYTGTATGIYPTATGFTAVGGWQTLGGGSFIYIAIRRGPMRTPTLGTTVFTPIARNGTNANATITTGFTVDLHMSKTRTVANSPGAFDRLRGAGNFLNPSSSAAEDAVNYLDSLTSFANNTGVGVGADSGGGVINFGTRPYANWAFSRAPGFMDVVCYTGNASNRTVNHNLGVAPELMMIKSRSIGGSSTYDWIVYAAPTWGTGAGTNNLLKLNTTIAASFSNDMLNNTQPTSSVFSLGFYNNVNASGQAYVAYLFASCPGVSKVGSYTGNGSSQTINCGFTTGSRFVMIKRTDSAGDWYIWDSARGIVAGDDPYLALNSIAAEVTSNDSVDTDSSGFIVNQVAASDINVSAATYIFLAVA